MKVAQLTEQSSQAEVGDVASKVIYYAQSLSDSPGVTAMVLSHAVALFALNQDAPIEAIESQLEYLQRCLEVMKERLTS